MTTAADRREYYQRLEKKSTAPLWEAMARLFSPEPRPEALPVLWRFQEIRPLLLEAGRLITAREAQRRVLVLENPGLKGQSQITGSLYAGLQLVMPGEVTSTHRHMACAIRFIIEGTGAYTAVEGERTTMHPGDFILTPSWTWHDHGNPSAEPVIWLDGLDVPMVNLFDTGFIEGYPGEAQPVTATEGDAHAAYGSNLLPFEHKPSSLNAPLFCYPYARSREALHTFSRSGAPHSSHGFKMQYANPATGGSPMPTIGAYLQLLPAGFHGAPYRATDGTVYCVAEGSGRSRIGEVTLEWTRSDIFVVPSWSPVSHECDGESVLFSFSDRPAQKALGLWRESA